MNMKSDPQYVYSPLFQGSPIGGAFFLVLGALGIFLRALMGLATAFKFIPPDRVIFNPVGEVIFLLYSFAFMAFGAAILFYKKEFLFTRVNRTFVSRVRLPFLTLEKRPVSFEYLHAVQISRHVIGKGTNLNLMFTVSLVQEGRPEIRLERFFRYQNAKRVGELLALALQKPLHDNSSGRIVVKQPGEFRENLRTKLQLDLDISEEPLQPHRMESDVVLGGDRMTIHIPPFGIIDSIVTIFLPSSLLFFGFAWIASLLIYSIPFEIIAFSLSIPIAFVVVACSFLFRDEFIEITQEALTTSWTFFGFYSTTVIPLSELEGLFIIGKEDNNERLHLLKALTKRVAANRLRDFLYPFRCLSSYVIARSPRSTAAFGRSLDIEELLYLNFLIETYLKTGSLRRRSSVAVQVNPER